MEFNDDNFAKISKLDPLCFVIMPFHNVYDEVYNTIVRATETSGIKSIRADSLQIPTPISSPFIDKIKMLIKKSYYIIVDISGLNANVFYELGMAHILREEFKHILILKDNFTECPSDLAHLNYISYERNKMSALYDIVIKFINEESYKSNLKNLLLSLDLISEIDLTDLIINDISNSFGEKIDILIDILNNDYEKLTVKTMNSFLLTLSDFLYSKLELSLYDFYLNLLNYLTNKLIKKVDIKEFIEKIFSSQYDIRLQTKIATTILRKNIEIEDFKYTSVLDWISNYLSYHGTTEVDVNKFKIQTSILENNTHSIKNYLMTGLENYLAISQNKDNKYDFEKENLLAEHFLLLCREKKIGNPNTILRIIEIINAPFVIKSAIDLLESLEENEEKSQYLLKKMFEILSNRDDKIVDKYDFLKERIEKIKVKLK